MVREVYANLSEQVDKKVWVRGFWVPFDNTTINVLYQIPHVGDEGYQRLNAEPNYMEIIKCLTNGQGQWKVNSKGQVVNLKAKDLTYVPKTWHHFITSRILPSTNVREVTKERAILNYAILQYIKFDMGAIIKDTIWFNKEGRMKLGHSFLIFQLCKQARVKVSNQEDLLHPIKEIVVRQKKGVLRSHSQRTLDSDNESLSEEEEEDKEEAHEPALDHGGALTSTSYDLIA